jgi:hypothetical protein
MRHDATTETHSAPCVKPIAACRERTASDKTDAELMAAAKRLMEIAERSYAILCEPAARRRGRGRRATTVRVQTGLTHTVAQRGW